MSKHLENKHLDGTPLLWKAQRDALRSQLESLQGEITAYENLR